jgi:hypothetical protein
MVVFLPLASCEQRRAPSTPAPTPAPPAVPTFKYVAGNEYGCGNLFLYKGTTDGLEVLWIKALKIYTEEPAIGTRTYDISALADEITIGIDMWGTNGFGCYCNEFADDKPKVTWKAKKGKVSITISDVRPAVSDGLRYKASARLEGVVLENNAGKQATLELETINAAVYWTRLR